MFERTFRLTYKNDGELEIEHASGLWGSCSLLSDGRGWMWNIGCGTGGIAFNNQPTQWEAYGELINKMVELIS